MTTATPPKLHVSTPTNYQIAAAVFASCFGWSLDLFDLFLLLFMAPVIGRLFFPANLPTISLAAVYASFAVTLLMRPVGSALFGAVADKSGRKRAMTIAVIGVGVGTAAFGVLPTIAEVGIIAPVLFVILRLVQGVFVGGVVASTHTIGTESVPERWRGALSGFIGGGGGGFGALLASIALAVMTALFPGPEFAIWGWRCMFFTGLLSAGLGLFIFRALEESPLWQVREQQAAGHKPVRAVFTSPYRRILLINLLITIGCGGGYYLTSGFLPSFLRLISHMSRANSSHILIFSSLIAIIAPTLVGAISQVIGRKRCLLLIGVVNLIALPLIYGKFANAIDVEHVTMFALLISLLGNIGYAPVIIFLNERFPTLLRATGTGLSWNIGFAIGGTMPFLVSFFSGSVAALPATLSLFCAALFVIYLIGALIIPETKGRLEHSQDNWNSDRTGVVGGIAEDRKVTG